jgi:hypothetical protein
MTASVIRAICLRPYDAGWAQPTPAELRALMVDASLTAGDVARLVGASDARTVRRWTSGACHIPYASWALLCEHAGIGRIWTGAVSAGGHHGI